MILNPWDKNRIQAIVSETCKQIDTLPILSTRKDKTVVRLPLEGGKSLIVKLWSRSGAKAQTRRLLGISPAYNEWKQLNKLAELGIKTPKPYGFSATIPNTFRPYTEALIIEDLGNCIPLTGILKNCVQTGNEEQVFLIEENLISMTSKMIQNNILDADHGLINCVYTPDKEIIRLDLELTKSVISPTIHFILYAKTLGKLLETYTYAVQPDTRRTTDFAQRLCLKISPPSLVLKLVRLFFFHRMKKQKAFCDIDNASIHLPW